MSKSWIRVIREWIRIRDAWMFEDGWTLRSERYEDSSSWHPRCMNLHHFKHPRSSDLRTMKTEIHFWVQIQVIGRIRIFYIHKKTNLKSNQQKPKWPKIYFTVQISKTILSRIKWFGRRWWVTTFVRSRSIRDVVSNTHTEVFRWRCSTTKIRTKKNTIPER
jgi:hypothetical protein